MVEQIKKLCAEHKTTVKSLEKELGFGNGTIRRWDTNAPSVERISMVANRFNVPMSYLMGETDDPSDRSKTHWAEIYYGGSASRENFEIGPNGLPFHGQKEKPALSKEDEQKTVDEFLDGLTPAELVDLISKASAKLKGDGLL